MNFKKKSTIPILILVVLIMGSMVFLLRHYLDKKPASDPGATNSDAVKEKGDLSFNDISKEVLLLASDDKQAEEISRLIDPLYLSDSVDTFYIRKLAEILGLPEAVYKDVLGDRDGTAVVYRAEFEEIYDNILSSGIISSVEKTDVYIPSIDKTPFAEDGTEYTVSSEISVTDHVGKIVEVYAHDREIVRVTGPSDVSFSFRNVWLMESGDNECTFMAGNDKYVMKTAVKVIPERLCDLTFTNDGVIEQTFMPKSERGRILAVSKDRIRFEGRAWYDLAEDFVVYDLSKGEPGIIDTPNMLVGFKEVRLISDLDHTVRAAIVEDSLIAYEEVRVLLSDSSYSEYKQKEVAVTSEGSFAAAVIPADYIDKDDSQETGADDSQERDDESELDWKIYEPGETAEFKLSDYEPGTIIKVRPVDEESLLTVLSLKRGTGNPSYRGYLELTRDEDCFYLVNGVAMEQYLYSVVSSELPSYFSLEAQKALAVCARGYAFNHIEDGTFAAFGANLDDSIMCQVYNNYPETEISRQAVNETYGVVMTYDGYAIRPYYFSTSAGVTCSNEDIWGDEAEPYLTPNIETLEKPEADLSDEETFRNFIDTCSGCDLIEKDQSMFRWSVSFTTEEVSRAVADMLPERLEKSGDWIEYMDEYGVFRYTDEVKELGTIEDIEVTERSAGGVIQEMIITGSLETIRVHGQTNFRNLISPAGAVIKTNSDSELTGWTSLPSTVYYVEKTDEGFTLHGGGFGHGVGLSQYGAQLLAEDGHDYRFILMHYYCDIRFDNMYSPVLNSQEFESELEKSRKDSTPTDAEMDSEVISED